MVQILGDTSKLIDILRIWHQKQLLPVGNNIKWEKTMQHSQIQTCHTVLKPRFTQETIVNLVIFRLIILTCYLVANEFIMFCRMSYFQVGQKITESEPRHTTKLTTRPTENSISQSQIMQHLPSMYLNQNINEAQNLSLDVKQKARMQLQQLNQNTNVIPNQNNIVTK